ncbi:MAG: DNA polymerase III subunit gamma/tau [Firmicutes bacterium]|nr:DNA polymerase III subunit gamma/tau [Bacillota bacterium]
MYNGSVGALYRKYRPTNFEGLLGQQHITTTLLGQIKSGMIGHAYLFVGSRGTGKTTAARIFARAINCTQVTGKTVPCGKCESCKALQEGNLDILEIDAASNNGVDEIRSLKQNLHFMPTVGKYKVYIIDEVHMLSQGAFNALLKTLEEPPKHIVFVLATTEPHRLPATILSRCMRFDFALVERQTIASLLSSICKAEKKQVDKEALEYIAMRAEGSFRDGLSILDTVFAYCDKITTESVQSVLGTLDRAYLVTLLKAVQQSDIKCIFESVELISKKGLSVSVLAKDVVALARDLLLIKVVGDPQGIVDSQESIRLLKKECAHFEESFLLSAINVFSGLDAELRYASSPRSIFEVAAINLSKRNGADVLVLQQRIDRLEETLKNWTQKKTDFLVESSFPKVDTTVPKLSVPTPVHIETEAPTTILAQETSAKTVSPQSIWGRMVTIIRQSDKMMPTIKYMLTQCGEEQFVIEGVQFVLLLDETDLIEFSKPEVFAFLQGVLSQVSPRHELCLREYKPLKVADEIERLKKLVGNVPMRVTKTKSKV